MALDMEAASYVERHGLEDHLSNAVDAAIKAKAEDPLAFISAYLSPGGNQEASSSSGRGGPLGMSLHVKARTQDNPDYPLRIKVTDAQVRWTASYEGYDPNVYTHPAVLANARDLPTGHKWADPEDAAAMRAEVESRITYCKGGQEKTLRDAVGFDRRGWPLNPVGRTGIAGRGLLGKWGPNHAADPIVTRFHPESGQLQVVAIQRKDTLQWALPGGMVDAGESVSAAVKREFSEETGAIEDVAQREQFQRMCEELFANGQQVYRGYVDDPRSTDHAWMETTAFHFHCPKEIGDRLPLHAGDDAGQVSWLDVSSGSEMYKNLYGAHRALIDEAIFSAWGRGDVKLTLSHGK